MVIVKKIFIIMIYFLKDLEEKENMRWEKLQEKLILKRIF